MEKYIVVADHTRGIAEQTTDPGDAQDTKEARFEHPSGLLYLLQYEGVPVMLDAMLDLPPGREFTVTEFADHASLTRQTVGTYVDHLLEVDVIDRVHDSSPLRYRLADSRVVVELFELNGALNAARD